MNFKDMDDDQLEGAWQSTADMIGHYAMKSWHTETKSQELEFRKLAEECQKKQSEIQAEITRRHEN